MSRLIVPLLDKKLWSTGDILLRAELDLLLKDSAGNWQPSETFRVDSATDMTTMPAYRARQLGLPMPVNAAVGVTHAQSGLDVRSGYLRVQVAGMDQTEYAFPCFFLGDPSTVPNPKTAPALMAKNLLGLSGVVNQIRISFDGDPTPGALYGYMIVEKK
jgi:hypothetical protein